MQILNNNLMSESKVGDLTKKILKARIDPRNSLQKKREEIEFDAYLVTKHGEGRIAFSKLVWITRNLVLDCSFAIFGELLTEDKKRQQILKGFEPAEVNKIRPMSNVTVQRAEQNTARESMKHDKLVMFATRLVNPLTEDAYTQSDLQKLYLNMIGSEEVDALYEVIGEKDKLPKPEYLDLCRRVHRKVDEELFYAN